MSNNITHTTPLGIIGAGGLGREALCCYAAAVGWGKLSDKVKFLVEEVYYTEGHVHDIDVLKLFPHVDNCDEIIIAVGEIEARRRIAALLSNSGKFATIIHPNVSLTPYTHIGHGSIVLGNTLLSCDVEIGSFAVINPGTTISHDAKIGHFFTASPGVHISGNCTIGDNVFMGTNASIRNGTTIAADVVIGMGAVVVKDILTAGTYIGNPAVHVK